MPKKEIIRIDYKDGEYLVQETVYGKVTSFFPNGNKKKEENYIQDRKNGYEYIWDSKGILIEERPYKMDELHGVLNKWDSNGTKILSNEFVYGYFKKRF